MKKFCRSVAIVLIAISCTILMGCNSPNYIEFQNIYDLPSEVLSAGYSGNHTSYEITEGKARSISGMEVGLGAETKNVRVKSLSDYTFCTLKVEILSTEMSSYVRMSEDEKFVDIEIRARYRDKDNEIKVHVDYYQLKKL